AAADARVRPTRVAGSAPWTSGWSPSASVMPAEPAGPAGRADSVATPAAGWQPARSGRAPRSGSTIVRTFPVEPDGRSHVPQQRAQPPPPPAPPLAHRCGADRRRGGEAVAVTRVPEGPPRRRLVRRGAAGRTGAAVARDGAVAGDG